MNNQPLSLLIVSGRSGSGKSSVLHLLEDFGYYCIDNLPVSLVINAIETLLSDTSIRKIALGIDIRSPKADLSQFADVYQSLHSTYQHNAIKVIYTTAHDNTLVARFDATRRIHPLMASIHPLSKNSSNLPKALKKELELLLPISSRADIVIDTTGLNIHELKQTLSNHLGIENKVLVNVVSFGFKYGSPIDADYTFDVRILPNPHWEEALRPLTGLDTPIHEFFANYPEVDEMGEDIGRFLSRWLPECLHNNRHTVTIAIGCTGGKHRSVYISEKVSQILQQSLPSEMSIAVQHREKNRWNG